MNFDKNNIEKLGAKTLIEYYIHSISHNNLEESRNNPTIQKVEKQIQKLLIEYEEDAKKYNKRRKSDRIILGH